MKRFLLTTVFLVISSISAFAFAAPPPVVRVLVESGPRITIHGGGERIGVMPRGGRPDEEIVVGESASIIAGADGLQVDRMPAGMAVVLRTVSELYSIGERHFRGKIEVIWKSPEKVIVVNHVPLEDYLAGLLGSEMYPHWPIEALKAQAVAARTYAMHHSRASRDSAAMKDYDVMSTVLSQVYEGAHKEYFRAHQACEATAGMALLKHGAIFPTYYHSCCGGLTEHAHNVWGGASGPPQIKDRFCARSPKLNWTYKISVDELGSKLNASGISVSRIMDATAEAEVDSPRNKTLILATDEGGVSVLATDLRRILGYANLKSTWFDVARKGDALVFTGRGYGHGVGMCQWGAKGMADEGYSYDAILKHYYPDAELARMY